MASVTIGIAGWSLPGPDRVLFPPAAEGSNLARYAAVFNAVEINSSFYRPHRPETYARWADSVPAGFRFAVKLPRSITHEKRLHNAGAELDQFTAEAGTLGLKLGWVLVQTPPSLRFDAAAAAALFSGLQERLAGGPQLACEARHGSWFTDEATALLRQLDVIRVVADPPAGVAGPYLATAAGASYVRLHGSPHIYRSPYEPERLARVAAWLGEQPGQALVIFDNTMSGTQASQALQLRTLLQAT
ncbi:DUF72 domain-containing protein [Pseudoduganella sp. DS3]|uniref:DUF72 domain-containing protein n=1 Tax=Pseudoduganella guangdongensis TaxID=2692179 RepID=A0A6N9HGP9_9BURK|nr:DUF72 domain-containing protein [Pseudoduganella guangdongensis]MYN02273.1 DUF72 domain-containing protein [Pseudoduganella guangdongensis]